MTALNALPEIIPENSETVTSASSEELRGWLQNLDKGGTANLIEALRQGRVKVTTAAGFNEMAALAKSSKSNEVLAAKTRQYAEEYARDRARLADENAVLTQQKVVCQNTIYYLLKAFEGVAANADKIVETTEMIGIGEDGKMPGMMNVMGSLVANWKKIYTNGTIVVNAFDGTWLRRIDLPALQELMSEMQLDLSGYDRLTDLLHTLYPTKTIQLPA